MYRILYIDDEPSLLEIAKLFLERSNDFSVDIDTSAEQALHTIGTQVYHAIVSDFQMPGMDGIELLKSVRGSHGNIPFILFTGRGREEVVIEAINNGVDFYLQKGGDPKAQFAELEHKIRQAIARRQAENSLNESEKRLADIINFLPDATFAIDRSGQVIAWNHAIEEMTGVPAVDILGKGEYEYAIPFYGKRRPILIDLIFKPEEDISNHYKGILREKDVLIAETDLPQLKGVQRTLMGKASPLFNQKGQITGAIESIRDITRMKETEQSLQEQNQVLAAMNQFSLELALLPAGESIGTFIVRKLMKLTGGVAAWYSDYHPADHTLIISHLESGHGLLEKAVTMLGKDPREIKTVVSSDDYTEMVGSAVKKLPTLTDVSFGQIPPVMSFAIQKVLGIDHFFGLVYVIEGELFATSVLAIGKGKPAPSVGLLESFSHMVAVSLRRRSVEEKLRAGEEKFRTVADFTYDWEYWEAPDHSIVYMSPSCERISGYTREEFQQNSSLLDSIVDPRDREVWENHRKEADKTTTALSLDFRMVRKDGDVRWINHTCHPVFDPEGRHLGRRASNRDITEKKRVNDELRAAYEQLSASQEELQGQFEEIILSGKQIQESEEKFRTFMEASIDGVLLIEADGTILAWNPSAEQIFGIPASEALKSNIVDLQIRLVVPEHQNPAYIEDLRSRFSTAFPELFSRNSPLFLEVEAMNARGRRMMIQQALFPIQTSVGKRIGCIVREVTEQRNAEKNLRESEAKYRELAELLPQMVFEMDLGFRVTYANQIALTTMGVADKDLEAGVSALSFLDPSDLERIRQNIEKTFRGETVANHEYTAVRRDGSTFPVMIYAAPFSRFGKPAGFRGILIDITDQKRTENTLRESERFLEETQKIARLGGWKANPHTDYLEWTDGIYDIIEAPCSYRPGLTEGMKYYAPEDIQGIRENVAACLSTGKPFAMEALITTETGKKVWTELRGLAPVIEGACSYVIGTLQDITERKLNEDRLRESRDRFKVTIASLDDAIFLVDPATRQISECNAAATRIFGYLDGEMVGRETNFLHVDQAHVEQFGREAKATYDEPGYFKREFEMRRKDGCVFPTEHFVRPIHDPDGRILYVVSVVRDITERKRAKEALWESEERFRTLADVALEGIMIHDNGIITDCNPQFAKMFGYTPEEIIGRNGFEFMMTAESHDAISRWIQNGAKDTIDVSGIKKDGTRFYGETASNDVLLQGKQHTIVQMHDITARKESEQILQKQKAELSSANEQLAAFEEELRGQYEVLAKNERDLRESEERFKTLFEKSAEAQLLLDGTGKVADCNAASLTLFALKNNEGILGHTPEDFAPEFQPDGVRSSERGDEIMAMLMRGGMVRYEWAHLKHDAARTPILTEVICTLIQIAGQPMIHVSIRDITDRKKAEEALLKHQQQLEEITGTIPGVVYQFYARPDGTMGLYYVSSLAPEVFGISSNTSDFFERFTSQVDPRDRETLLNSINEAVRQRSLFNFEGRFIKPSGETIWFQGISRPFTRGTEIVFSGVLLDITDRKQTEEALQESEQNYRGVIENLQDVFYRADAAGNITMASPSAKDVFGYSSVDEVIGLNLARDFYTDPKNRRDFLTAIQKTGSVKNFEAILKKKDGSPVIVSTSAHYYHDPDGNVLGVEGIAKDITEWKHAEEALRESEEKFRAIIDQSFQFIGLMNTDGTLIEANRSALAFAGISESDVINRPFWETPWWSHSADLQEMLKDAIQRAASGETVRFEATHPAADGHLAYIDFSIKPMVDTTGRILYLIPEGRDITERKQAEEKLSTAYGQLSATEEELRQQYEELAQKEEKLRVSEEKFRALVESTSDFIWEVDERGTYTYVSPQVRELLGYEPEEFIGKIPFDFMQPDEARRVAAEFSRFVESRLPISSLENSCIHKNGSIVVLETSGVPRLAKDGSFAGYRGIDRDITMRKHAEEALRNSEAALREKSAMLEALFNAIPDVIGVQDLHHGIIRYNAAGYAMVGKNPGEVTGKRCYELIGHDTPCEICATSETYRSKKPAMVQKFVPEIDAWLDVRSYPVLDDTGEIRFIIEHLRDISNQKRAEESIREKTEEIKQYFSTSLDLFCIADTDGYFRRLNPEWEKTLGYTLAELEGKRILDLVHPDDLQATLAAVATLRSDIEVLNFTNRYCHKDGTYRWLEWRSILLGDRIYAAARDITERRNMENAVREVNRKLNLLNSVTRHDVANQIMVLRGYTQIAEMENPGPVIAGLLVRIDASSLAIARLIEFTRMYQELGIHTPAWFRLDEIIATTGKTVVLLSGTCNQVEIFADPLLERVFFNLFDNADRHGERVTEVTIRCEPVQERLVIIVEDNGVGIPSDEKEKIFGRGYGKNTGLGLFLAREILAITGITISETGVPGKGARFEIAVPDGAYRFTKDNTNR